MVYPLKSRAHIEHAVGEARKPPSKRLNIEFGSLTAFAMSGEGVPTLQADQLNVIAHHLHTMKTKEDLRTNKSDWPLPIDSPDVKTERLKISRLTRRRVQQLEPNVWDKFHKSKWKQLNRYHNRWECLVNLALLQWIQLNFLGYGLTFQGKSIDYG